VQELSNDRVHPVFLLDEAHLLHQDTLDHLHILLNYGWDSQPLLSLVLIGLPELADRLALRRNRSLAKANSPPARRWPSSSCSLAVSYPDGHRARAIPAAHYDAHPLARLRRH